MKRIILAVVFVLCILAFSVSVARPQGDTNTWIPTAPVHFDHVFVQSYDRSTNNDLVFGIDGKGDVWQFWSDPRYAKAAWHRMDTEYTIQK